MDDVAGEKALEFIQVEFWMHEAGLCHRDMPELTSQIRRKRISRKRAASGELVEVCQRAAGVPMQRTSSLGASSLGSSSSADDDAQLSVWPTAPSGGVATSGGASPLGDGSPASATVRACLSLVRLAGGMAGSRTAIDGGDGSMPSDSSPRAHGAPRTGQQLGASQGRSWHHEARSQPAATRAGPDSPEAWRLKAWQGNLSVMRSRQGRARARR